MEKFAGHHTQVGPSPPFADATVLVVRDAFAIPESFALYDGSGNRIARSLSWHGARRRGPAPEHIDPPEEATCVDSPVLFAGLFPKPHFGHVVLEMFARLWPYDTGDAPRGTPFVHFTHYGRHLEAFEEELLKAGLPTSAGPRIRIDRPMRLSEVLLPSQAIVLRSPIRSEVLPLYDRARVNLGGARHPDPTPLYLSRSRLRRELRSTLGEAALEERLRSRGFRIAHPQELPLRRQVELVGNASTVVGLAGSALHLTVFRGLEEARTISLGTRAPFCTQSDVEALRGSAFVHLHAQFPIHPRLPGGRGIPIGPHRNFLLPRRTDAMIAALL